MGMWDVTAIERALTEAAIDPSRWDAAIETVSQVTGGGRVARALTIALCSTRAQATLDALSLGGSAAVLLDRTGAVLRANAAAERLLAADPRIEHGRVVSSDRNATDALDRALEHALDGTSCCEETTLPPVVVPLPRQNKRPLLAYTIRLASVSRDEAALCQVVLVLVDPEAALRPPEAILRSSFGLTEAEARLASQLAAGEAIERVSSALGIAKATARNQLKSIFVKTGTHRQAELVALLGALLGQFFGGA